MSYGFQIRITKPITLHPEAMVQGVRMLMGEAGQILEHRVGLVTPQGVGGTRKGLAAAEPFILQRAEQLIGQAAGVV